MADKTKTRRARASQRKRTTTARRKTKTKAATSRRRSRGRATRSPGKRDLVKSRTATLFAKRTRSGRFREMDEVGRSLGTDRRRRAKTKVRSGYGDRGDR
jgi:hypothetical protein